MSWLDELTIKMPVAISGGTWNPPRLTHVERLTKRWVITSDGRRWNKVSGHEVGSTGYHRPCIEPWTTSIEEAIERNRLESWLCSLADEVRRKKVTLTLDALRKMRGEVKP